MQGREVVIVDAVRTPIGRGHREGAYRDIHPSTLLATVFRAVLDRSGVDPSEVEDVIAGCVNQVGEQSLNIARDAWLEAGLPLEAPGTTIDRQCGSGQQAVNFAAAQIAAGVHDVVVAGGVEHMGHIPIDAAFRFEDTVGTPWSPELLKRYHLIPQGLSAELIAETWSIGREELDEIALRSHTRAAAATDEGRFERELVRVGALESDQGIRRQTSAEALAALRPAFKDDGVVTAGNSSQISDGAAALLLMARERADALGVRPRARIVDQTTVGVDPVMMLTGPIPATRKLLGRNSLRIGDIDRFEVNEAFASVVAAWAREVEPDMDRVNVNGGAIALGHALGSTGARLLTSLVHELEASETALGMVVMCCGGGIGTGTLIERL